MRPRRRAVPGGRAERRLPRREDRRSIDGVAERRHVRPGVVVPRLERANARRSTASRRVGRVDRSQRDDERSEVAGELCRVVRGISIERLAREPGVDAPAPRVALGRLAHPERDRDRERQVRRQTWRPLGLELRLPGRPVDPREADRLVLAQAVQRVIGPGRRHRLEESSAQAGNAPASSRRTSPSSIGTSPSCIVPTGTGSGAAGLRVEPLELLARGAGSSPRGRTRRSRCRGPAAALSPVSAGTRTSAAARNHVRSPGGTTAGPLAPRRRYDAVVGDDRRRAERVGHGLAGARRPRPRRTTASTVPGRRWRRASGSSSPSPVGGRSSTRISRRRPRRGGTSARARPSCGTRARGRPSSPCGSSRATGSATSSGSRS